MNRHFSDYYWKNGRPQGISAISSPHDHSISYKIVIDPYYKRISVEKYRYGIFHQIAYDSLLLDFRKLSPREQLAWQRETIEDIDGNVTSTIRDIEDRLILIEQLSFEKGLCRSCKILSPHGVHLSTHRMFYKLLEDSENAVILFDSQEKPCMKKIYQADEVGEFQELIEEQWDMSI